MMNKPDYNSNLNERQEVGDQPAPPPTNRGVLNTGLQFSDEITLDWLQATFVDTPEVRAMIRREFKPGKTREKGLNGYDRSAIVLEYGTLLWSTTRPEMGIHLILPSQALALYDSSPYFLMSIVVNNGGKVRRVDFAMDDKIGLLSLETIAYKLGEGDVVSRFKKWKKFYAEEEIGSKSQRFTGVTIGNRQSESYIRIYDKAEEMRNKGAMAEGPEKWIRVELESKGDRAEAIGKMFVEKIEPSDRAEMVRSLVYGLLDFKEPQVKDENKSRWITCSWWHNFLSGVAKSKLSLPKSKQTIAGIRNWFEHAIAPMAAVIMLYNDDPDKMTGYEWMMSVIADGQARWTAKHYKIAGIIQDET